MSPNELHLHQGGQPTGADQYYYTLLPATVTNTNTMTHDNNSNNINNNADADKTAATNMEVWEEVNAFWHHAQMNGLEAIPGLGGVGGEIIQDGNFQEHVPVTSILLDQDGQVKKEEDVVKDENQLATVVSVYVPPPPLPGLQPAEPIVLGIGEIPPGFETKQDRRELLNQTVQKLSEGNQPMRKDLTTRNSDRFINGEIEGLFETYVYTLLYNIWPGSPYY